jgi:hypothetical protein
MPVSKKRKKDGKPARRSLPPSEAGAEQPHAPDAKVAPLPQRMGRPTNPFVAQQQQRRGAQRGR